MPYVVEGVTPRTGKGAPQVARFLYDFAALGGGTGAKTLTNPEGNAAVLPDNAVLLRCYTEMITPMTSGGAATVKLGITGNDDCFVAATNYNDASWDVADDIAARNAELPLKVNNSAGVSVLATIATQALTAGKFEVIVEYNEGA